MSVVTGIYPRRLELVTGIGRHSGGRGSASTEAGAWGTEGRFYVEGTKAKRSNPLFHTFSAPSHLLDNLLLILQPVKARCLDIS